MISTPYTCDIFGLPYVSSLRHEFKNLFGTEHQFKGPNSNSRLFAKTIAHNFFTRYPRQSMVVKGSKTHKKASPRSAGQATSPHNAVGDPVSKLGYADIALLC
jgi:hypothetical protein